jgi:hypothetical protein
MNRPLTLHLKAASLCALGAIVLALPLLWVPLLPGWEGWRPPMISPRAEALLAVGLACWVAWCVIDIPRRGLKVLIWFGTLWLLGSGIWLAGLYGWPVGSLVPLTAVGLAGAGALAFSFTPAGSRRARWESLVGDRVSRELLRTRIDERHLEDGPHEEVLVVAEVLWRDGSGTGRAAWEDVLARASLAAEHFQSGGGYLERCDGEGARVVFGCWGGEAESGAILQTLWEWVAKEGGTVALTRGDCQSGVGRLPTGARWTLSGAPLRRAARMAATARGYAARLVVEDSTASGVDDWSTRRLAWWDFEGERVLLREVVGPTKDLSPEAAEKLRRWERAWEAFWEADWASAGELFAALTREDGDAAARIFALRSAAARQGS